MADAIPKGPEGVSDGAWDDFVRRLKIVAAGSRTGSAWFAPEEARHTLAALRAYEPPKPPGEPDFDADPIGWLRWQSGKGRAIIGERHVPMLVAAIDALAKPAEPYTAIFQYIDEDGDFVRFEHDMDDDCVTAVSDGSINIDFANADQFLADLAAFFERAKARHAGAAK